MTEKYNDFVDDGELDDVDFEELDAFIEYLRSLPPREGTFMVNPMREEQLRISYAYIKRALLETESYATVETNRDSFGVDGYGAIRVRGVDLAIADMERFNRAAEFASNIEVYPLTNGQIALNLTFHGLVVQIE